jgi:hypothetical protein
MTTDSKFLESFDVVEQIISAHPSITRFHVLDVPTPPFLQERVPSDCLDPSAVEEALQLKRHYGMSFWDAYFVAARQQTAHLDEVFLAALMHDTSGSRLRPVDRKSLPSLRRLEDDLKPGRMLAVSSLVELRSREIRHIPMLDLHYAASAANLRVSISAVNALRPRSRGLLLQSGKSYHYYGFELLTGDELMKFLASAILLGPIIDRRWIAHQLIEGACALRIGSGHGYQNLPFVVAELP